MLYRFTRVSCPVQHKYTINVVMFKKGSTQEIRTSYFMVETKIFPKTRIGGKNDERRSSM